jgi:heat shock protein HtpX
MFLLKVKMFLLLAILFAIVYAVIVVIGTSLGVTDFYVYLAISFAMMFAQYMLGPKLIEWTMRVRYVSKSEQPRLYQMVESMARQAQMPVPKICIAQIPLPNAFAFGRSMRDGRVCVTEGIMRLLNDEELKAVLGHELSHLKNRDVLTITLLSVIPMILYRIAWQFLFFGRRRDSRDNGSAALIGLAALLFYFVTNLLVLYASRIREYFADRGSILLGNKPQALASSLYKLVYGSARMPSESLREVEGLKAFFLNDPSQARNEIRELAQLDLDRSGTIDADELRQLSVKAVRLSFADKVLEALSTHPNMLKRIKQLSEFRA